MTREALWVGGSPASTGTRDCSRGEHYAPVALAAAAMSPRSDVSPFRRSQPALRHHNAACAAVLAAAAKTTSTLGC